MKLVVNMTAIKSERGIYIIYKITEIYNVVHVTRKRNNKTAPRISTNSFGNDSCDISQYNIYYTVGIVKFCQ